MAKTLSVQTSEHWIEIQREFPNELSSIGIRKKILKGEVVFGERDPYDGFFEIVSGIFKVYSLSQEGKEAILKVFYPGELIASHPIFQPNEPCFYPAFCEALKEGELIYYPKREFTSFLFENTKALYLFSAVTIQHLNYFRKKLVENLYLSVKDRILNFLKECGASQKFITLPISKNQLASLIGTTPESVSRAFRSLLDECILEEKDSSYRILKENHPKQIHEYPALRQ
ncbi:Crp/Fnr family transcriptional regulator [Leptospira selangorensis]|uniref:Crp/Fnr family transcriptional regulator n=1 Tax=Leptospira selangorensis TaxID=2484982 RepID=A0A5F2C1T9_9LEPT|nr:Crp/Fnr family transcriptional regulator [Leptospira selangorensis]TGM13021.1 Crp/Fnr family transcriptional regulator [Leptospira selangorensis]TGM21227.1 Crp/Fnr family transcriptional regulator [Leptospira selangorensis]